MSEEFSTATKDQIALVLLTKGNAEQQQEALKYMGLKPNPTEEILHTFSIEKLYHFRCNKCTKWWSIADWTPVNTITCPHCSNTAGLVSV